MHECSKGTSPFVQPKALQEGHRIACGVEHVGPAQWPWASSGFSAKMSQLSIFLALFKRRLGFALGFSGFGGLRSPLEPVVLAIECPEPGVVVALHDEHPHIPALPRVSPSRCCHSSR